MYFYAKFQALSSSPKADKFEFVVFIVIFVNVVIVVVVIVIIVIVIVVTMLIMKDYRFEVLPKRTYLYISKS